MKIDEQTLNTIEKLAKLNVDAQQRELTRKKIDGVLDMLDKINMEEIANLDPLYHPLEVSQPFRKDQADDAINREVLQSNAPQTEKGLFLVPKVIE